MARSRAAGGSFVTSRPPMTIRPPVIVSRPPIERRSVVFPHPDGPTSTMNSPSPIVRLTSLTARTPFGNSFVTWSRTISPTAPDDTSFLQSLPHRFLAPRLERSRGPELDRHCAARVVLSRHVQRLRPPQRSG